MILALRTDNPEAELYLLKNSELVVQKKWLAHKALSNTIHTTIKELLAVQKLTFQDITGIICFEGPGSFTGLRIGISVVNALGSSLNIPVIGVHGDNWIQQGIQKLPNTKVFTPLAPLYGSDAFITKPKK